MPYTGDYYTSWPGRPTEDERELIKAVKRLVESEDGSPMRAFASGAGSYLLDAFKEIYDVDRVTSGRSCLKKLKNKKKCTYIDCDEHAIPEADHPDLWFRDGEPVLVTYHLYKLEWRQLQEIIDWCRDKGYEARMHAWSWYFPTRTIMVVVTKVGDKGEALR